MADLASAIDEIHATVEAAKGVPLSASAVVHRAELLEALDGLRALVPQEVRDAQALLGDREAVLAQARADAEALLAEARAEAARLAGESEVLAEARRQAEALLAEARAEGERLRREVDDYVDGKLATFEVVLHKTLGTVERGRDRLRGRSVHDELAPDALEDAPAPALAATGLATAPDVPSEG